MNIDEIETAFKRPQSHLSQPILRNAFTALVMRPPRLQPDQNDPPIEVLVDLLRRVSTALLTDDDPDGVRYFFMPETLLDYLRGIDRRATWAGYQFKDGAKFVLDHFEQIAGGLTGNLLQD